MLAAPIACERFEAIARRHAQVIQACRRVQQEQLAPRLPLDGTETPDILILEEAFRVCVGEAPNHVPILIET